MVLPKSLAKSFFYQSSQNKTFLINNLDFKSTASANHDLLLLPSLTIILTSSLTKQTNFLTVLTNIFQIGRISSSKSL